MQNTIDRDEKLQVARYRIEEAESRLDTAINAADTALKESAQKFRGLLEDLNELRGSSFLGWPGRFWQRRALQSLNDKLQELQHDILPTQGRNLVRAHADRMQLSVDGVVYESRDRIIQAALGRLRELHHKLSGGIEILKTVANEFDHQVSPISDTSLRRPMLAHADLTILYERLVERERPAPKPPHLSAWDICSQPADKTRESFRQLAEPPFRATLDWTAEDFSRFLRIERSRFESLATWLKNAGSPLLRPASDGTLVYSIVQMPGDSEPGTTLKHLLPDSELIFVARTAVISALQVQCLSNTCVLSCLEAAAEQTPPLAETTSHLSALSQD